MYCGENIAVKAQEADAEAVTIRCRRWSCPICEPHRKDEFIALAFAGKPQRLVTITWRTRPGMTRCEIARAMLKAWKAYVRKYRGRKREHEMEYLLVWELTQKGTPHAHILCRCGWIDQDELSDFMRDKLDSPIVDVRNVVRKPKKVAYTAKYLTKANALIEGTKRYFRSTGWAPKFSYKKTVEKRPGVWKFFRVSLDLWLKEAFESGYREVTRRRDYAHVTRGPPRMPVQEASSHG